MSDVSKLSFEINICNKLIELLPRYSKFSVSFEPGFHSWMPFCWQGFRQSSRYVYVLEGISDWQRVLVNFSNETRGRIRKAKKNIQIKYDLSAEDFYSYHTYILKKIGKKINYSFDLFKRIHDAALAHNCGKISYAVDDNGLIHCASFLVWDTNCAYALLGAFDRDCNPSGASFLLYQEEIKYASQFADRYNLGCTMNKTLSYAKRRLGANVIAYHHIYKVKSKLIKIAIFLTYDFWY
ncbi:hypothetical protein SAMN06265350_10948 [Solitalea koreensis]|uniref:Acetyltransferase (GNAT) domain-containing protein n=2 Tax=Solitalea koreensis TaxID=543615 RepID=A0A521DZE8_9SPHI|nr:hypothetical protein SAMN06265350_10948 [Solitalea koreensis]